LEINVRFLAEARTDPARVRDCHLERCGEQGEWMRAILDGPNGAVGVVDAYKHASAGAPTGILGPQHMVVWSLRAAS
jgi:hypothetical protein